MFSCTLAATCGITAGSGFASTCLRVLLSTVFEVASKWWPPADFKLYVDELTPAASARRATAANVVGSIVDFVVRHFEAHLELEVSAAKSMAIWQ